MDNTPYCDCCGIPKLQIYHGNIYHFVCNNTTCPKCHPKYLTDELFNQIRNYVDEKLKPIEFKVDNLEKTIDDMLRK